MSFVQRLRMANMFPVRSDLGNARIPIEPDIDIESLLMNRSSQQMPQQANGLQRVSQGIGGRELQLNSTLEKPLQFGGVVGGDSNPGADILNRARGNAENLWQSYKKPQITADEIMGRVGKPSRDEENYQQYLDNALKTRTVDSNIAQNERRIGNEERRLDQADDRIDLSRDNKQLTNELNQSKFDLAKSKEDTKQGELDTQKNARNQYVKDKTQEALNTIDGLIDSETGKLKPDTEMATGWSANIPMLDKLPFGVGTSKATGDARINKLKSLLTLDVLQELKAMSKTGATGFGAMNLKELGVLENAASMLGSPNMREEDFAAHLQDIRGELTKVLGGQTGGGDFEILLDPNNIPRRIPKNQVEEALKRGARRQ